MLGARFVAEPLGWLKEDPMLWENPCSGAFSRGGETGVARLGLLCEKTEHRLNFGVYRTTEVEDPRGGAK